MCGLSDVVEAAVIGVSYEIFGQTIKAFVHAKKGREMTERMVLRHCSQNLEPFMIPKYVEICNSLPKNENGKFDKAKILKNE